MKRCSLNPEILNKWIEKVGGVKFATDLIQGKLKCSRSKAEKIAGNRYPSKVTYAEQKELAVLLKCKVTELSDVRAFESEAS